MISWHGLRKSGDKFYKGIQKDDCKHGDIEEQIKLNVVFVLIPEVFQLFHQN